MKYYNQICHLLQREFQRPERFTQHLVLGTMWKPQAASDCQRLFTHTLHLLVWKTIGYWSVKRSNISVLEEIQPKRRLLSHVQSQMMKYFGHIARRGGNSLEKVIMQGCVEGRRKPGRPRTRWIDQIKSMVGCPLHELYNLVQDRQRWCDVVAVASCQSWQDRTDRPTEVWHHQIFFLAFQHFHDHNLFQ